MKTKEEFRQKLDIAIDFMKKLREELGIDCCIAGGTPRDMFFGLIPKDIDIILLLGKGGFTESKKKKIESFSEDYFYTKAKERGEMFSIIGSFDHYNGPKVKERIDHIWKVYSEGFDLLAYKEATPKDVTDAFDFNLNQFVLNLDTMLPEYTGSTPLDVLTPVRGDAEYFRVVYMEEKHKKYMELLDTSK